MLQRLKEAEMFKEWEQQEDQVCKLAFVVRFILCIPFQFHLEQAKLRSAIRIESGRGMYNRQLSSGDIKYVFSAKPIDVLAKYVNSSDSDVELQEPYQLLRVCACHYYCIDVPLSLPSQGLNRGDLEDLLEDIKVYIELENQQHLEYWKVVFVISTDSTIVTVLMTNRT